MKRSSSFPHTQTCTYKHKREGKRRGLEGRMNGGRKRERKDKGRGRKVGWKPGIKCYGLS